MLQRQLVAKDANGRRRASLHCNEHRLVGQEAMGPLAESLEAILKTFGYERREPEIKRTANQAWRITALGQVVAQAIVDKIGHALRGSRLPHVALLPTRLLQPLLEIHHAKHAWLEVIVFQ